MGDQKATTTSWQAPRRRTALAGGGVEFDQHDFHNGRRWGPARRVVFGTAGVGLCLGGLQRRGWSGGAAVAAGAVLLARSISNRGLGGLLRRQGTRTRGERRISQQTTASPGSNEREARSPEVDHLFAGASTLETEGSSGVMRRPMHDAARSPDDEVMQVPLGPGEEASVSFHPDPTVGDAGSDLAGDLGRSFLEGAVTGRDQGEESADGIFDVQDLLAEEEAATAPQDALMEEEPQDLEPLFEEPIDERPPTATGARRDRSEPKP